MLDQAEALRMLVKDRIMCCREIARPSKVYTVAVTSGKGGVGKTSIAVNLAQLLARSGRRVWLIDADFGLSNAEVMLGVSPKYGLADIMSGRVEPRDAWVDTTTGIKLLSSGSGLEEMANIDGVMGVNLINRVVDSAMDGDVVVIDTAPGISQSIISLLTCVDEVMMVTTPEPTSITDTYAAIKVLTSYVPDMQITLLANCCANPAQAHAVAKGLEGICMRFLKRSFQRYEYMPKDSEVGRAIQSQKPFVTLSAHSNAASWLRKIAIKLDDRVRKHTIAVDVPELVGV